MNVGHKFYHSRLGLCEVIAVHVFGTIDVLAQNGEYYRITGLGL